MLARLLLALLAIVFATPVAAAACHAQPARERHASMAHHGAMDHGRHQSAPAAPLSPARDDGRHGPDHAEMDHARSPAKTP